MIYPNETYIVAIDDRIVSEGGMLNDWDFMG
jgi:hypothetical protein